MRVALLTREYPPEVYGGAGVHVEYLARELRRLEDVTVHAWGTGDVHHHAWEALAGDEPSLAALRALSIDLTMAARTRGRRPGPQPHLVRQPRRPSVEAGPRDSARRDRSQPRAAAAVEGRAARRRVRDLELGREDRARGGRRGDRGVPGHLRRHPARVSGDRPRAGSRHLQRHRHVAVLPRCRDRRA